MPRLDYVVDQEHIKIDAEGKKALIKLGNGDMRRVLNILQSTWIAYNEVSEANVYSCVGHPTPDDIKSILDWLLSTEDFQECYDSILFKCVKLAEGGRTSPNSSNRQKTVIFLESRSLHRHTENES